MAQIIPLEPLFERLQAREKKFNEVVVFVHNYGGHRLSFKRHIDWVNELGFDAITFDLPFTTLNEFKKKLPLNKEWRFGLRHLWADKIEQVLSSLGETKILYSFSMPSMATLMSIERRHAIDVKAWICDGGPMHDTTRGISNLFSSLPFGKYPVALKTLAFAASVANGLWRHDSDANQALRSLPEQFPILSVRCENDDLVSPEMIDQFFSAELSHLKLQVLNLSKAGHLLGMKEEPDLYKKMVGEFLLSHSTLVSKI